MNAFFSDVAINLDIGSYGDAKREFTIPRKHGNTSVDFYFYFLFFILLSSYDLWCSG